MPSWSSLVFILCGVLTPALSCDWLRHFGCLNGESLKFVRIMGGPLTKQESPVPFPYRLYSRIQKDPVESQLVFIRDSLKMISNLYRHDNFTSVNWDNVGMERFLSSIHRQTVELSHCVSEGRRIPRKLRNYYRRLARGTLDHTGGSVASWELIRKETKNHLDHLDVLVNLIVGPDVTRRSCSTRT